MIGTICRSIQHIEKCAEILKPLNLILFNGSNISDAVFLKGANGTICLFNNVNGNTNRRSNILGSESASLVSKYLEKYNYVLMLKGGTNTTIAKDLFNTVVNYNEVIMLPYDFEERYDNFIKQNNKQFLSTLSKTPLTKDNTVVRFVFCVCNTSINFFNWFIKNYANKGVNLGVLYTIMQWNERYSQLAKKLSKGTITAYNGYNNICQLIIELNSIRYDKRVNDAIIQFNTAQKNLLREHSLDKRSLDALNAFCRLSETKRNNFIRKVSDFNSVDDIINQMTSLCDVHFLWNKESFLNYISTNPTIKSSIVYEKGDIIILKVDDYETIKRVAKTTNWCISKNKQYWNNYILQRRDSKQFVLFDFSAQEDSELSIVGFTTLPRYGIVNAHSFTNENLLDGDDYYSPIPSFMPSTIRHINTLFRKHNIPVSLFCDIRDITFEWNRSGLIKALDDAVGIDSVDIILDEDNKFVFRVNNYNIYKLFQDHMLSECGESCFDCPLMFFCDFNKSETDSTKLMFSAILNSKNGEEYGRNVTNSNLNSTNLTLGTMLKKFNLPFNTIKRIDSPLNEFKSSFTSLDLDAINDFLNKQENIELIKGNALISNDSQINDEIYGTIEQSIIRYKSFSLIDLIYNHGLKLDNFISKPYCEHLVRVIVSNCTRHYRYLGHLPTEMELNDFYSGRLKNNSVCYFIGLYVILQKICQNENKAYFNDSVYEITHTNYLNGLTEFVLDAFIDGLDLTEEINDELLERVIRYINKNSALNSLLNKLLSKKMSPSNSMLITSYTSSR